MASQVEKLKTAHVKEFEVIKSKHAKEIKELKVNHVAEMANREVQQEELESKLPEMTVGKDFFGEKIDLLAKHLASKKSEVDGILKSEGLEKAIEYMTNLTTKFLQLAFDNEYKNSLLASEINNEVNLNDGTLNVTGGEIEAENFPKATSSQAVLPENENQSMDLDAEIPDAENQDAQKPDAVSERMEADEMETGGVHSENEQCVDIGQRMVGGPEDDGCQSKSEHETPPSVETSTKMISAEPRVKLTIVPKKKKQRQSIRLPLLLMLM
ncbi:uncharacterized protein LOC113308222 isoform X2 [Papaver somniferum]|uniref:uncharacterized protein LOC113308222 isoform X2 n=1 Tax=Papaver somniferum TaxID=3469 RepID=UPI000E703D59|nr:uncharacterized protein LOC113308222 isoform X2 [Papaver somniferum]